MSILSIRAIFCFGILRSYSNSKPNDGPWPQNSLQIRNHPIPVLHFPVGKSGTGKCKSEIYEWMISDKGWLVINPIVNVAELFRKPAGHSSQRTYQKLRDAGKSRAPRQVLSLRRE